MSKKVYLNSELKQRILHETEELKQQISEIKLKYSEDDLNKRPSDGGWSANECFHHLNMTYKIYLPNIHKGISRFNGTPKQDYRSGFAGDRMIRSMAPSRGEVPDKKKIKTFKKINPDHQPKFVEDPIERFHKYTEEYKAIIEQLESFDLAKIKVTSLAGPIIRFKLGDALQVIHVHNKRHIIQAQKALESK